MKKAAYTINGENSGFALRSGKPEWRFEGLYGDDYDAEEDADESGNLVVYGRKEAIAVARRLCATFSPCVLDDGEQYLVEYVVRRADTGDFVYRASRTETGK